MLLIRYVCYELLPYSMEKMGILECHTVVRKQEKRNKRDPFLMYVLIINHLMCNAVEMKKWEP